MPNSVSSSHDIATRQPYLSERFKAFLEKKASPLSFRDFMGYALYDSEEGYYSSPKAHRVGKEGDFITSVSVGSTFAQLITEWIKTLLDEKEITAFHFIEIGPEGGQFAEDFLSHWDSEQALLSYYAIEFSETKRNTLDDKFSHQATFRSSEKVPKLSEFTIVFSNEVLDAFPVHLLEFGKEGWQEIGLITENEQLQEQALPKPSPLLSPFIEAPPTERELGYRTEICTDYLSFFQELSQSLSNAHLLFFDYYLSKKEYYASHRSEGTLQTYSRHTKTVSPYEQIGKIDMSCHVNFDLVNHAATQAGFHVSPPLSQGQFLTHHAREWLLTLSPDDPNFQKTINEFKTLTMPGLFGTKFQVVEMSL